MPPLLSVGVGTGGVGWQVGTGVEGVGLKAVE